MSVLVTGGAGFIGRAVIAALPLEVEVVVVDCLDPLIHGATGRFPEELLSRACCLLADVGSPETYAERLAGVDVVVHLAAATSTARSMYEPRKCVDANVAATATLLETLRAHPRPRRFVLASSRAVYGEGAYATADGRLVFPEGRSLEALAEGRFEIEGPSGEGVRPLPMSEVHPPRPVSVYGLSKLWQEQLVECLGPGANLASAILRMQNVYGPRQQITNPYTGILGVFADAVLRGEVVELFEDGRMTRDFIHVADVAEGFRRVILHPGTVQGVFNLGSGQAVTLEDFVRLLAEVAGQPLRTEVTGRFRHGDIRHASADISRFTSTVGEWSLRPLKSGLKDYLAWYRQQDPPAPGLAQAALEEMRRQGTLGRSR